MRTSSAGIRKRFQWARCRIFPRSSRVVVPKGSTTLIRKGSMILFTAFPHLLDPAECRVGLRTAVRYRGFYVAAVEVSTCVARGDDLG